MSHENYEESIVEDLIITFTKPSLENITSMLVRAMQLAGSLKGKTGLEKKTIVISSIREVVDRTNMAGDLEPLVLSVIPSIIDNIVAVDNNTMVINPKLKGVASKVVGVMSKCCGK